MKKTDELTALNAVPRLRLFVASMTKGHWPKLVGGTRIWWHPHDVLGPDGRYYEVKRTKQGFGPCYAALEEYEQHNEESGETGEPIVLVRQDRKPWMVVMFYEGWLRDQHENNSVSPGAKQRSRPTTLPPLAGTQRQT